MCVVDACLTIARRSFSRDGRYVACIYTRRKLVMHMVMWTEICSPCFRCNHSTLACNSFVLSHFLCSDHSYSVYVPHTGSVYCKLLRYNVVLHSATVIIVVWRVSTHRCSRGPTLCNSRHSEMGDFCYCSPNANLEHCLPFLCDIFPNDNIIEDNSDVATRKSIQRHVSHFFRVVLDQSCYMSSSRLCNLRWAP